MINIKNELYNNFGALSKKYFKVLATMVERKIFSCAEITQKCKVSFRLVTDLINSLSDYTIYNNQTYQFKAEFIEQFNKEIKSSFFADIKTTVNKYKNIVKNFVENKSQLDHISATSETAIKRALHIYENYDTDNCKIALVGDHDFTSIALSIINPNATIVVIDIDNDILEFIDNLNLDNITTVYADFRVGIPSNLEGVYDLVFTDPPYTAEGMDTFLKNAKFLLKKNENSVILCAYTCGDIVIKNGWNVQKIIINNGLYIESITPKFHIYNSAQSLGYCADLYILRQTNLAYKDPIKLPNQWNIYTHGNMALESKIENNEKICNLLSLSPSKNGLALMEILKNGINFCQFQKFEELYFEQASLFSYNLLQLLINLHTSTIFLNLKSINIKNNQFNYFFNIEQNGDENFNYKLTTNNGTGGILVQKSFMKLESVLIKHISLILNKTKNQMRELIETSKLIYKYREFQIGSIPLNILIKIIDILMQ